jgi:hypothetical protein
MIILLKNHEVTNHFEKRKIDGGYIAETLSRDWGFWYDATQNLQKIRNELSSLSSSGKFPDHKVVTARLDQLSSIIDTFPKTPKWNSRAKVGTASPWYTEISEVGS